jgi:hypothetical protein
MGRREPLLTHPIPSSPPPIPTFFTMPPATSLREELIAKINKRTPFHIRLLFLYIGFWGMFYPGSTVIAIASRVVKEPELLEGFAFLREIED